MNYNHTNYKYKCIDCIHCDVKHKKCYPNSKDCRSEYDLTEDDIYKLSDERCDFFHHINVKEKE